MRITFIVPHILLSGGIKIVLSYANGLTNKGHDVTIICPEPGISKSTICGIPVIYPKRTLMNICKHKPDWMEVKASIKYVPSFGENNIPDSDIIVASAWKTSVHVNQYPQEKGEKFYLIQHYESMYHGEKSVVDRTYEFPLKKIVVSSWLKDLLKTRFNANSELIINPVDLHIFFPKRRGYNKRKRICMLYHNSSWKGVSDGLRAFEFVKEKHPDIQLVMYGTQKSPPNIDCEYHQRPLSEDVMNIYNSCDIFLCPSWKEGFGLPSAEAMACKCALVTTDTGGCRDYAIHEQTALMSTPHNPLLLAYNLIKVIESEALLIELANNGYNLIKKNNWENAIDRLEHIFSQGIRNNKLKHI